MVREIAKLRIKFGDLYFWLTTQSPWTWDQSSQWDTKLYRPLPLPMDPSFLKCLVLLYYRQLYDKTSFYFSTNHLPFITCTYYKNHEITLIFFFGILSLCVVKCGRGFNELVYTMKGSSFFACYQVQRTQCVTWKGVNNEWTCFPYQFGNCFSLNSHSVLWWEHKLIPTKFTRLPYFSYWIKVCALF